MSKINIDGQEYEVSGELPAVGGSKILVANPIKSEPKRWEVNLEKSETEQYIHITLNQTEQSQGEAIKASVEHLMKYIFEGDSKDITVYKLADRARRALERTEE